MKKTKLKFRLKQIIFGNVWVEMGILATVNLFLLGVIIHIYSMTSRLQHILGFLTVLTIVIIASYKSKFENLNFDLSKKGKIIIFVRACMPYILQAFFFAQCSLIIAWILINIG